MNKHALSIPTVIHLFAAAHAAVAALSRMIDYVDDVPLTVLTISMIVIISLRRGLQAEMMAALTLIGTFLGYLFGTFGQEAVTTLIHNNTLAPAITTALVTEILGWTTLAFSHWRRASAPERGGWAPTTLQIIAIASAILLLRISYTLIFNSVYFQQEGIYPEFQRLMSNTFAVTTLLCGNVIFVSLRPRLLKRHELHIAVTVIITALLSLAITLIAYYNLPHGNTTQMDMVLFLRLYAVVLLADIVVYTALKLIDYVVASNAELRDERGKKHRAQYQYNRLKLQINPHFLFNSLNILDFLVQEQQTERASAFIRKLAGTYRYMLKNEEEPLVSLNEELEFAEKYIDLLKERFTEGFLVEVQVSQEALRRHVVPCCLQLLIENATKHNIVSTEQPLHICIAAAGDQLTVTNNLQPRISSPASTGLGLKNIRQQYHDISGRQISVEQSKTEFCVKLPLL